MTSTTKEILDRLEAEYPEACCELRYSTPLELLIATVLSAQTTDKQVNKVTEIWFRQCRTLDDFLALSVEQIQDAIHTVGFHNAKAQNLYRLFRQLASEFHGEVPRTREELISLPGVGRKTANVVLSNAYGIPAIAVDTHVFRVANRIGMTKADTVEETEKQLEQAIDKDRWTKAHHLLIFHGRRCCSARNPRCESCVIRTLCEAGKSRN